MEQITWSISASMLVVGSLVVMALGFGPEHKDSIPDVMKGPLIPCNDSAGKIRGSGGPVGP